MDGFTYHNIFETKGIEYLAILAFFAMLVPFWLLLNKKIKSEKKKPTGILSAEALNIPQGLFFSKYHIWSHLGMSGVARVGMDDLLLHLVGEIKFSHILEPGERIQKGDLLAKIDHQGKILKIYSPISGEIIEANPALKANPALLNEDPYVKGWMYRIKPINWSADTYSYYLADEAIQFSKHELDKFKKFISSPAITGSNMPSMQILQDGGELIDQPLAELPEEVWQGFQDHFLGKRVFRNKECRFFKDNKPE